MLSYRSYTIVSGIATTLSKPVRHSELLESLLRLVGQPQESAPRAPRRLVVPSLDLSVLVVEDNPVNQLVATGLLEALGVRVEVADDGVGPGAGTASTGLTGLRERADAAGARLRIGRSDLGGFSVRVEL